MEDQVRKARAFRALHEGPGLFVIPNPWDAGSAKLLSSLGFEALATTSAGLAFSLGKTDGSGAVTRDETLSNCYSIVQATDLPVAADLENGFGDAPETCYETIKLAAGVGLVGGSIEDSTTRREAPIYSFTDSVERVTAAVAAARSVNFDFILTARAENYLHGRTDLSDTIKRLEAYAAAGADVLFAPGLRTRQEISTLVNAVAPKPVNVIVGLSGMQLNVSELADLGVKRISIGSSLARAAYGTAIRGAAEIQDEGTFNFAASAVPFADINDRFSGKSNAPNSD